MKPRKVHRGNIRRGNVFYGSGERAVSKCGIAGPWIDVGAIPDPNRMSVLTDAQFVWVPIQYQCVRCRETNNWGTALTPPPPMSATIEMQTIMEMLILAIRSVYYQPNSYVENEVDHRCWFDGERIGCSWCKTMAMTSVSYQTMQMLLEGESLLAEITEGTYQPVYTNVKNGPKPYDWAILAHALEGMR